MKKIDINLYLKDLDYKAAKTEFITLSLKKNSYVFELNSFFPNSIESEVWMKVINVCGGLR